LIGLSLFLTSFVMAPVAGPHPREGLEAVQGGHDPDRRRRATWRGRRCAGSWSANTRQSELDPVRGHGEDPARSPTRPRRSELPMRVVVPAFVLSS
jgi:flagellar biosynthesis protein FliP